MSRFEKGPCLASIYGGGRKRTFIGLLSLTCLTLCAAMLLLLILPWISGYAGFLRYICVGGGIAGIIMLSWLCLILIFHIYTKKPLPGINSVRHLLLGLFLAPMEFVGKIFGIPKEIVRRSFIKVNNELVLANLKPVAPDKVLLLLPHCIQSSACSRRLTYSLDNCRNCGKCQIGALRSMAKKYGIRMAIATGGTIARRIVVESRPRLIVAVACERDLASGIQDSYPIPVLGILNSRPCGPCIDTLVPMEILDKTLAFLLLEQPSYVAQVADSCVKQV